LHRRAKRSISSSCVAKKCWLWHRVKSRRADA